MHVVGRKESEKKKEKGEIARCDAPRTGTSCPLLILLILLIIRLGVHVIDIIFLVAVGLVVPVGVEDLLTGPVERPLRPRPCALPDSL